MKLNISRELNDHLNDKITASEQRKEMSPERYHSNLQTTGINFKNC